MSDPQDYPFCYPSHEYPLRSQPQPCLYENNNFARAGGNPINSFQWDIVPNGSNVGNNVNLNNLNYRFAGPLLLNSSGSTVNGEVIANNVRSVHVPPNETLLLCAAGANCSPSSSGGSPVVAIAGEWLAATDPTYSAANGWLTGPDVSLTGIPGITTVSVARVDQPRSWDSFILACQNQDTGTNLRMCGRFWNFNPDVSPVTPIGPDDGNTGGLSTTAIIVIVVVAIIVLLLIVIAIFALIYANRRPVSEAPDVVSLEGPAAGYIIE